MRVFLPPLLFAAGAAALARTTEVRSSPDVLLADTASQARTTEPSPANAGESVNAQVLMSDLSPLAPPNFSPCQEPSPLIHVANCLTSAEYTAVNNWFTTAIAPTLKEFKNDVLTEAGQLSYFHALDGSCSTWQGFASSVRTESSTRTPRLWVQHHVPDQNPAKDTALFFDTAEDDYKVHALGGTGPVTDALAKAEPDLVKAFLYCGKTGRPTTYLDANNNRQCWCCTARSCSCPNNQLLKFDGSCGCEKGYVLHANACVRDCPHGYHAEGDVCVLNCFWKEDRSGYRCAWGDREKTSLKLYDDCSVEAPVPKDNYVNDRRHNKYDQLAELQDPEIVIETKKKGQTTPVAHKSTWLGYANAPRTLENAVTLNSFGVFDLSMVASDYRHETMCAGCIAIVDEYRPTPETACSVQSPLFPAAFTQAVLTDAIAQENAFASFYAPGNVLNNGAEDVANKANVRADEDVATMTDFFESNPTDLPSLSTKCFENDIIKDLLDATPDTAPTTYNDDVLVCKRCCSKSKTLKEIFYEYSCATDLATTHADPKTDGSASCGYDYCVNVPGDTLIHATVEVTNDVALRTAEVLRGLPQEVLLAQSVGGTGPVMIHQSITCTSFDEGCKYEPKLSELFDRDATWGAEISGVDGYTASSYVYWRYSLNTNDWFDWDDDVKITFDNALKDVYVAAWTHCGRALQVQFRVVLHPHSVYNICPYFDQMWAEDPRNPLTNEAYTCAYPQSDFTVITFNYDSFANLPHDEDTVKGKYTDVSCTVKLKESGASYTATGATVPLTVAEDQNGRIELSQQVALELVRDPTTAIDTDVEIACTFTFTFYAEGGATTPVACTREFTISDCDPPEIEAIDDQDVCDAGACLNPDQAGPFEACNGVVFGVKSTDTGVATTYATEQRQLGGACCEECGTALTCGVLDASAQVTNGVQRCIPAPRALALGAITSTLLQTNEHAYSVGVTLLGVSAMVAAVAVVVVRRRRAVRAKADDDAYYALLE